MSGMSGMLGAGPAGGSGQGEGMMSGAMMKELSGMMERMAEMQKRMAELLGAK